MTLRVAVIGAGRMGQGIALALSRSGTAVELLGRTAKAVPSPLAVRVEGWSGAIGGTEVILVATPDAAIPAVAGRLATEGGLSPTQVVLHLSGLLGREALAALEPTGAALGSFHPLQTVASPETAADRLRGAFAAVEGDARAVAAGERLAGLLGMTPVPIPAHTKAVYHAGATLVANYTVALVGMAVRLARRAGVPAELARRIYLPLAHGAVDNLDRLPPAEALTGAIRRGDLGTITAHLEALSGDERILYAMVGLEALGLARSAGLAEGVAREIEGILRGAATGRSP